MKAINILLIFTLFIVGSSCQQKTNKQEEEIPEVQEEVSSDFSRILPNFPSAAEFSAQLQAAGADFNPSILLDPGKAGQYTMTNEKSAAMLGAYLYDLGYCVAFQKPEYTEQYYDATMSLAQHLGVEKTFLEVLMNRYKENINANDSVKAYFRETYQEAVEEMGDSPEEKQYLRTIFLAGFYIEGLNNLLQVINTFPEDELPAEQARIMATPIIKAVLSQKNNVYNLSKMLDEKVFDLDNDIEYQNAFSQLNDLYNRLNVDQLIAEGRIEEVMNNEVLQEMIESVDNIRNRMIATQG